MSEKKKLYSYHTFMFPFSISCREENNKFNLDDILEKLGDKWEKLYFNPLGENKIGNNEDPIPHYNEWKYFYKPVQHLLYTRENEIENGKKVVIPKHPLSHYFEYKGVDEESNSTYSIEVLGSTYVLSLVGLSFRIFGTGVGIISFNLENYDYQELQDINTINECGRRIYPQILPVATAKKIFLSNKLILKLNDNEIHEESFENYFTNGKPKLPKIIGELIPNNIFETYKIMPLIDDRMFTLCWYGNNFISNELKEIEAGNYNYLSNNKWAEYLFVEKSNSCQSKSMLSKLLEKHSYDRWIEYSTLYGISRYSFVCLSNELPELKKNDAEYIVNHMRTMYYQLITICLMQRATILNFKNRITNIVSDGKVEYSEIKSIQKDYLKFINSMCFREITAQEQGIELYNMAKDIMGIDEALKELDNEINELNSFYSLEENERSAKNSENLATMAGVFLVPTLLLTLMGQDKFKDHPWFDSQLEVVLGLIVIPATISYLILNNNTWVSIEKLIKRNFIGRVPLLLLILLIYIIGIA